MAPAPRTRIRLCGPLELEIDGREVAGAAPGGQAGSLLGYLVANRDRAASRDALIDVVWPERPPKDPQADLRPILSRLRRALGPGILEGKEQVRLALPEPVWVDLDEAGRAVEDARVAARDGQWERAGERSQAALELLRPGFLPGVDGDWAEPRRNEAEELALEALEWAARSGLERGGTDVGGAVRAARELVERSPYRETGYRFLMEALAAGGNVAEALRVYDDLRRLLRDELGVAPAVEVQAVHRRLLAAPGPAPEPARVPLPALLSPRERGAFIAREAELVRLRAAWRSATAGSRRLVLVSGEPGIGKTRLTGEFAREAHAHGTVLYAGCQEEALVPYQPFVEALRHYARNRALPPAPELAALIPELGGGPAREAPDDPETRRYLMFEAVSALLAEAAAPTPLLLVLDDLHWADPPTLQLLRHVIRAPQAAALLIVGAYRETEVQHPLAELLADLRRDRLFERIPLGGLDERGVGDLIASHAGHTAPSALVRTVHEETEGNPFFVEEVMRHLIETGVVFEREGRWTSARTADEIGVPEGVREVLDRRLARLSPGCRSVLAQAAVLGREFGFDVLQRMSSDEEALISALEEGLAAQLIVEAPGPAYAFTHALVRETLHAGLSGPRRQRLHARAATALESLDRDRVAALAVHYRLAGTAGDPAKAVGYSLRAGERARELFAWEDAAVHWDGALAVMERTGAPPADRAPLLVTLADLVVVVGDLARQIGYLERALGLWEELGDEERGAQTHSRLGMAHSLIDSIYAEFLDIHRAFRHYDAARPVLARGPVRKARGHLETGVATALTYGLRIEQGVDAAIRAMEIAERLCDEPLWAAATAAYAWHKIVAGELREGLGAVARAFDVADRRQRSFVAWMATNMRGQMTWGLGDPGKAQAWFERPLRLPYFEKTAYYGELADGVGRCHASRGEFEAARGLLSDAKPAWITHSLKPLLDLWDGNWDEVDALAREVLETSRRNGNRWDEWASHHLAARVAALRGEHERACALLEEALTIVVDGGARYFEMWVRPDLARALVETGRPAEARVHVARCREIMGGGDDWRGRAGHVELAEAMVLAAEGREADAAFGDAVRTLRRYELRVDEADALHQWGRAGAPDKIAEALEIYRRYGAGAAWLRRVEAV
jgi:DNA-binding SARP family transcriptional activator/tetratricopeptide (TPR) repeat protein